MSEHYESGNWKGAAFVDPDAREIWFAPPAPPRPPAVAPDPMKAWRRAERLLALLANRSEALAVAVAEDVADLVEAIAQDKPEPVRRVRRVEEKRGKR